MSSRVMFVSCHVVSSACRVKFIRAYGAEDGEVAGQALAVLKVSEGRYLRDVGDLGLKF